MSTPPPFLTNTSTPLAAVDEVVRVSDNVYWQRTDWPWKSKLGFQAWRNVTHTACLASDRDVQHTCCTGLNGTYRNWTPPGSVTPGWKNESTLEQVIFWCELDGPNEITQSTPAPNSVQAYGECFDRTVESQRNPGLSLQGVSTESVVYSCEGSGDFDGQVRWGMLAQVSGARKIALPSLLLLGSVAVTLLFQ